MKHITQISATSIVAILFIAVSVGPATAATVWSDSVGVVSATVDRGDHERGLTVRSGPSNTNAPVGFLPEGTEVRGANKFKNGYVQLTSPSNGGWVRMDYLKPVGGDGVVISIDRPELCLRIRSGPGLGFDKVGCAEMASKLELTGVWSANNWAQVESPVKGWVLASQINSVLAREPTIARSSGPPSGWSEPATSSSFDDPWFHSEPEVWVGPRRWRHGHWGRPWGWGFKGKWKN